MSTAGPKFTGTGANSNDGGTTAWTNPTNIQGDTTGTAATCAPSSNGATSQRLRCSNFGFTSSDIPSGSVIDGVTVEVEQSAANANRNRWNSVRLLKAGSETGNDKSDASAIPTSKGFKTFGGSADGWGASLTQADVVAPNFGVSLKIDRNSSQSTTTSLFRCRVTVTFHGNKQGGALAASASTASTVAGAKRAKKGGSLAASAAGASSVAGSAVAHNGGALAVSAAGDVAVAGATDVPGGVQGGALEVSAGTNVEVSAAAGRAGGAVDVSSAGDVEVDAAAARAGGALDVSAASEITSTGTVAHRGGALSTDAGTDVSVSAHKAAQGGTVSVEAGTLVTIFSRKVLQGGALSVDGSTTVSIGSGHVGRQGGELALDGLAEVLLAEAHRARESGTLSISAGTDISAGPGQRPQAVRQGGPVVVSAGTLVTILMPRHDDWAITPSARWEMTGGDDWPITNSEDWT